MGAKDLLIGFQDDNASFYAFDPLMMEISTDFTTEFHSPDDGHNVEGFALFKSQSEKTGLLADLATGISATCSENACSTECTESIKNYVDAARDIMWKWRDHVVAEDPSYANQVEADRLTK